MDTPAAGLRERVAAFLGEATGARRVEVTRWERLSGGAIQENVAVEARLEGGSHPGTHLWVVRCDAPSSVAVSRSRSEEFVLLQVAHAAGVRVPRPLWLCDSGAPRFFVMEHVTGVAAGHRL